MGAEPRSRVGGGSVGLPQRMVDESVDPDDAVQNSPTCRSKRSWKGWVAEPCPHPDEAVRCCRWYVDPRCCCHHCRHRRCRCLPSIRHTSRPSYAGMGHCMSGLTGRRPCISSRAVRRGSEVEPCRCPVHIGLRPSVKVTISGNVTSPGLFQTRKAESPEVQVGSRCSHRCVVDGRSCIFPGSG